MTSGIYTRTEEMWDRYRKTLNTEKNTCKNCGNEYEKVTGDQKWCKKCIFIEIPCKVCKATIKRRRTEYEFHIKKNENKAFYCSKICQIKDTSKYGTQICLICKKEIPPKVHKGHFRKYCSRLCYDIAQNQQVDIECLNCGKIFKDQPHRRFCSRDCGFKYKGETSIETKVKDELNKRGILYQMQVPYEGFYLDFVLDNKIVIECDGIHWHSDPIVIERDIRKNKLLLENGFTMYRFTDKEINENVEECINKIIIL